MRDFPYNYLKIHTHGNKHKNNFNCYLTCLPTLRGGNVQFSNILLTTKTSFVSHITAELATHILDPTNKVREVMRVILPSIKSRRLKIVLNPLSDP